MSIIINGLVFSYDNHNPLFENISFALADGAKASIIGDNGTGKSTLLRVIAGELAPFAGEISASSKAFYIPQQVGCHGMSVAQAMGVADKIAALQAITAGSTSQADYDTLADDWEIEARTEAALERWMLPGINPDSPMDMLSGGEKTKVLLAGIAVHDPGVVLMDEPTNHLDTTARRLLYDYITRTKATLLIVSHDITLLDRLDTTYELSPKGLRLYGGNYSFYKAQKELETAALEESIGEQEKSLRLERLKAQQVKERQERRNARGERHKDQLPRILRKGAMNRGENTGARLKGDHDRIIEEGRGRLTELRSRRDMAAALKIDFDDAALHEGKLLVSLRGVNHAYPGQDPLWEHPLDLDIYSGDRLRITGDNGSGKTTLVRILTGALQPSSGRVRRSDFSYVYMDQEYSALNTGATVLELAMQYNRENLAEHEVKTRLHRALFPAETWDKPCRTLSGGERMRLFLCCLMLSNHTPDLFILDEPTNNLDISSLEILTRAIGGYRGSVVLISHDADFAQKIGVLSEFPL